jgi:predicted dienelactone hydrolase
VATATSPELASRTIVTTVAAPDAPGPFPLIVLSHGLTGTPAKMSRLAEAWATAGYVVALPAYPLTNGGAPNAVGNAGDVLQQPADVPFVIDQMLALNTDDTSPLYGRIDGERIGAAGHSLGAATTYGVTFSSCCIDERIDAIVILAGFLLVHPEADDYSRQIPVMIVHGDADPVLNISLDRMAYDLLTGPKWFVTLHGGSHSSGIENLGTPYDALVDAATTDFWNAYLADSSNAASVTAAKDALRRDAVVDGLSSLETTE